MTASKKLKITIAGPAGSGKTTIAVAVTAMLAEAGFAVDINDPEIVGDNWQTIVPALKQRRDALIEAGLEFEVVTEQTLRESAERKEPRLH